MHAEGSARRTKTSAETLASSAGEVTGAAETHTSAAAWGREKQTKKKVALQISVSVI